MPQAANDNVKYRISWAIGGLMIGFALTIDALQFFAEFLNVIPGLGVMVDHFLSLFGYCCFVIWFALSRVSFTSGKQAVTKLIATMTSIVAKLIPFVDALPALTANVAMFIILSRDEDRKEAAEEAAREAAQMETYMRQYAQISATNARLRDIAKEEMARAAANDREVSGPGARAA